MLAELRALLEREGDRVCAIVVEPMVQAAGGMLTHDASLPARRAARCADEYGALLVADEVATGIGRTGRMWAVEHAGVTPDLLTCGKGLTAGYLPLSAVLATEEVYEAFLGSPASRPHLLPRPLLHRQPVVLRGRDRQPRPHGRSAARSRTPRASATCIGELDRAASRRTTACVEIRRIGTMTGIEVRVGRRAHRASRCARRPARNGVLGRPLGDVVVLMPPLAIGDDDLETLVATVDECIREVIG